ncbi:hypothetical protein HSRCO_3005 (plasmid) [Halanaeroarchaeum sp. HSR-CO]|nr:hypothetical protein HSRCO_3005 [Halanaeroarchaeum sp. HSR-CO]
MENDDFPMSEDADSSEGEERGSPTAFHAAYASNIAPTTNPREEIDKEPDIVDSSSRDIPEGYFLDWGNQSDITDNKSQKATDIDGRENGGEVNSVYGSVESSVSARRRRNASYVGSTFDPVERLEDRYSADRPIRYTHRRWERLQRLDRGRYDQNYRKQQSHEFKIHRTESVAKRLDLPDYMIGHVRKVMKNLSFEEFGSQRKIEKIALVLCDRVYQEYDAKEKFELLKDGRDVELDRLRSKERYQALMDEFGFQDGDYRTILKKINTQLEFTVRD